MNIIKPLNIISIGDADYEYKALVSLFKWKLLNNKNIKLKSVRFIKAPSQNIIIDQINVLLKAIKSIVLCEKHLDLKFEI